jgi:hypothetical protein
MMLHVQANNVDMEFIRHLSEQLVLAKLAMDESMLEDIVRHTDDFSIIPYNESDR